MSDFDLLVRSAEDFGISAGQIVARGPNLAGSAAQEINAHGLTIFPGVIDAHVHFNEPGRADWEGFRSGSRAAAAGGTTAVFDMPLNAHPPTIDGPAFDAKRAAAAQNSFVDFALWGGLVPGNLGELAILRDRGVVGLKAFMCDSGIEDFAAVNRATLRAGMQRAAELDLLVAVHAESDPRPAQGETVRDFLASRPVEVELEAIRQALDLAHETGCRLHIVHVSCGRGVALIAEARRQGVNVTCETCPHYLWLTDEDMIRLGAVAKCAPPLRARAEQDELWAQLREIATIGSDHSPAPWSMKEAANFFKVWGGISGCQHLLPLLLEAGSRISHPEIARLTSKGVAERFRMPAKGSLEIGHDADLTFAERGGEEKITAASVHYRHPHSPYIGRPLRWRIVRTILRGRTIFENGRFCGTPSGKFLRPSQ